MNAKRLALSATALLLAGTAQSVEFNRVQIDKSRLAFTSKQMGVPVDGQFGKLKGQVNFDPAAPTAASAQLEIEVASIDAGSQEANDEVVGKQWLDAKAFPIASFVSTGVKALGGNRFEVVGKLTVKGRTRDLAAPFAFEQQGSEGVFDGEFVLKRLDFGIGEGPWSDIGAVANEIRIQFHLVAGSGPADR
jgi:polyisoprenoid-binding protein YceI